MGLKTRGLISEYYAVCRTLGWYIYQVLIFLPPVSDAPERFKKTKKDKDMEMSGWIWHVGSNNG